MSAAEFSVTVLDLPVDEATPLAAVFDQYPLFCADDNKDLTAARAGIYLGATYTSDWGGVGAVAGEHLPALLREVAPGSTWLAWDEPYEDYLGTAALYAPDLGTWTGECDSAGEVYIPASTLTRALVSRPSAFAEVTGLDWRERIAGLRSEVAAGPPTAGFVPSSRPADAEWNRPTGLIYIDEPAGGTQVVHAPPGPDLGEISEPMARAATAALHQAGWQLMPAAVVGEPWSPGGHTVHVAQVYRLAPQLAPTAT